MPVRMLVVSETCQKYKKGPLSNQLAEFGRGRGVLGDESEYVNNMAHTVHTIVYRVSA